MNTSTFMRYSDLSQDQTFLPINYVPSDMDIICQKGRTAFNHIGNQHFRETVGLHLESYKNAPTKFSKSIIVNKIVDLTRQNCTRGFVRFNKDTNCWYEIGDTLAREKVGFTIRDELRKKDPVFMKAQRTKKRDLKRKRTAERNRSHMTAIVAALKVADKSLLLDAVTRNSEPETATPDAHWDQDSEPETATPDSHWDPVPTATALARNISSLKSTHLEVTSDRALSRENCWNEPLEETKLTIGESQGWFTMEQVKKQMVLGEEIDFSFLFD